MVGDALQGVRFYNVYLVVKARSAFLVVKVKSEAHSSRGATICVRTIGGRSLARERPRIRCRSPNPLALFHQEAQP